MTRKARPNRPEPIDATPEASIQLSPAAFDALRVAVLEQQVAELQAQRVLAARVRAVRLAMQAAGLDPDRVYTLDAPTHTATPRAN